MNQLEEVLGRMKNHSTNSCKNVESEEDSRDSDICPSCGGDEFILCTDAEGRTVARPCRCREKAVMSRRLRFAEIPQAFRGLTLQTFRADAYREKESRRRITDACQIVKAYLDNFDEQRRDGMGLYIWSRAKGSGKTLMAAGIANELLKGHPVKFAVSAAILQEIKNSWRKDAEYSESRLLDALCTVDILVIDDFGVETPAGWINDRFYQIINERYINRKVTVFTSNDPLDSLHYDDRITNRIKERTYQISFPEESVRSYIAAHKQERLLEKIGRNG